MGRVRVTLGCAAFACLSPADRRSAVSDGGGYPIETYLASSRTIAAWLIALSASAVFLCDIMVDEPLAIGVMYTPILFLRLVLEKPPAIRFLLFIVIAMTVAGFFLPSIADNIIASLIDRVCVVLVACGAAYVIEIQYQSQQLIREQYQRVRKLSQAVDQSPASVMISNTRGELTYVNEKFCEVTGYQREEVLGKTPKFLQSGYTASEVYAAIRQALVSGKEWRGEMKNRRKSGELFWEYASFSTVKDQDGNATNYIAVKEDITIRKEYEERLIKQANFDSLTGLPNRLLAMDRLSQAIGRAQRENGRVGVVFIDLDHFKKVNDTLGHAVGDKLLQQASERLVHGVRGTDTVARLGGDEFMIILPDLKESTDAELVAEKTLSLCAHTFHIDGHELQLSASVGITIYPDDDTDPHFLVRNADLAMYQAKDDGRGTFRFFTAEMNARAHEIMMIETEMRHAIDRNEFSVHYQPLVDLTSDRIIGAEALIRWNNQRFGSVSPGKFIPIAENTGLIIPLGEWVLCTACYDAVQWQKESGLPLQVAVNVSSRQFERGGFLKVVTDTLRATGLPPQCLKLEITEGVLLRDSPDTKKTIEEICALGVRLAIDDFGTGYSSLSYLRRLPFDTLKIDRSFVKDVPHSPEAVSVVQAVVAMAHGMHMTVIGEGVETVEQREFLKTLGCEISQGWLTGKPMPFDEFLAQIILRALQHVR